MERNETKKVTVSQFIEGYNKVLNEDLKDKYVKSHIVTNYSSILNKVSVLNLMLEKSVVTDNVGKYIDMVTSKINFVMAVLILYTNIEPDKDENGNALSWKAYDMLRSTNTMERIFACIGSDIEELMFVQNNIIESWKTRNNSIEAVISKMITQFSTRFGAEANEGITNLIEYLKLENDKTEDVF